MLLSLVFPNPIDSLNKKVELSKLNSLTDQYC